MLQWSRPQQRTETRGGDGKGAQQVRRFNGAVLSRGRRLPNPPGNSMSPRCFNGAVLSRGRRPQGWQAGRSSPRASMEPSSAEDGDAMKSCAWPLADTRLQWSRPQQRTETGTRTTNFNSAISASMEPSSAEDGDQVDTCLDSLRALELQWSRPQQRTETTAI